MKEPKIKKLIGIKQARDMLFVSFGLLTIFHVLVLLHIAPSEIVWGRQIGGSLITLLTLEKISLLITAVITIVIAAKMDFIKPGKFKGTIIVGVWIIFAYLILNTVRNLSSAVAFENLIFAPITLILAVLALRLAI